MKNYATANSTYSRLTKTKWHNTYQSGLMLSLILSNLNSMRRLLRNSIWLIRASPQERGKYPNKWSTFSKGTSHRYSWMKLWETGMTKKSWSLLFFWTILRNRWKEKMNMTKIRSGKKQLLNLNQSSPCLKISQLYSSSVPKNNDILILINGLNDIV